MNICDLCQLSSPAIGCTRLSGEDCLKDALKLIKASATNGDVIKALFLRKDIEIDEHKNYTQMYYTDSYITFPSSWWNAPYKAGDTE